MWIQNKTEAAYDATRSGFELPDRLSVPLNL